LSFFTEYLVSLVSRYANPDRFPSSRVTFVNFTLTPSSLQSQSLALLLKSEEPEIDAKRSSLLKLQGEYSAKLRELENALLQQINGVQGNILDDDRVINTLEAMKAEAADITQHVQDTQATMRSVEDATSRYQPLAHACTQLFFTLENLTAVHFLYQFSLSFFLKVLTDVLQSKGVVSSKSRLDSLTETLFTQMVRRVSKSLLQQDKLMFALRIAQVYMELLHAQSSNIEIPSQVEWDAFLCRFASSRHISKGLAIPDDCLERLGRLVSSPAFSNCASHLEEHTNAWVEFLNHAMPETKLPTDWDSATVTSGYRSAFRAMTLVSVLRPDRFIFVAEQFLNCLFGVQFPWRGNIEFRKQVETETESRRGVLLCSKPGFDASSRVDELADEMHKKLSSVAMGSAEGYETAEKALNTAIKHGTWLLLRNIHLCPTWLLTLEKKLYSVRDSCHKDFRLFLTSEIHPELPVNLIRQCDIFVFEPPSGVKASMLRSFEDAPSERVNRSPAERGRLYLLLAWFHAVVQERLRYVPIGWSKAYEFSQSDFKGACDVIDYWMDSIGRGRAHLSPDAIPWRAIKVILKESLYGGRVDNKFDQALMDALLDNVFCAESYDVNFQLVHETETLTIAAGKTKEHFLEWIHSLPNTNTPLWLGLPSSAENMLLTDQGMRALRHLRQMQESYGVDNASEGSEDVSMTFGNSPNDIRPAWIQTLHHKVEKWLTILPQEAISNEHETFGNPVFRCLHREAKLGNELLLSIVSLLHDIVRVCSNTLKPTNHVRAAMQNLFKEKIPSYWVGVYSVPHDITLIQWLNDFAERLKQLRILVNLPAEEVLKSSLTSDGIWVGGLFSPEAFLTAARQVTASELNCSLDELDLVISIQNTYPGCFKVRGLHLEGMSWTSSGFAITDSLHTNLAVSYLCWRPIKDMNHQKLRKLPVYLNSKRQVILFEVSLELESSNQFGHLWAERAVAFTAWK
jgi:dynein heavy chain 1